MTLRSEPRSAGLLPQRHEGLEGGRRRGTAESWGFTTKSRRARRYTKRGQPRRRQGHKDGDGVFRAVAEGRLHPRHSLVLRRALGALRVFEVPSHLAGTWCSSSLGGAEPMKTCRSVTACRRPGRHAPRRAWKRAIVRTVDAGSRDRFRAAWMVPLRAAGEETVSIDSIRGRRCCCHEGDAAVDCTEGVFAAWSIDHGIFSSRRAG